MMPETKEVREQRKREGEEERERIEHEHANTKWVSWRRDRLFSVGSTGRQKCELIGPPEMYLAMNHILL